MADPLNPRLPMPPEERVGKKIQEKRLFEAHFLLKKFSSEIDPAVHDQLLEKLTAQLSWTERQFQKADELEQAGKLGLAKAIYAELAETIVDYPSLDQARQRLDIALATGGQKWGGLTKLKKEVEGAALEALRKVVCIPSAFKSFFAVRQGKIVQLIICILLIVLAGIAVLLFFRPEENGKVVKELPAIRHRVEKEEPVAVRPPVEAAPKPISPPDKPKAGSLKTGLIGGQVKEDSSGAFVDQLEGRPSTISDTDQGKVVDSSPVPPMTQESASDENTDAREQQTRIRIGEDILVIQ